MELSFLFLNFTYFWRLSPRTCVRASSNRCLDGVSAHKCNKKVFSQRKTTLYWFIFIKNKMWAMWLAVEHRTCQLGWRRREVRPAHPASPVETSCRLRHVHGNNVEELTLRRVPAGGILRPRLALLPKSPESGHFQRHSSLRLILMSNRTHPYRSTQS